MNNEQTLFVEQSLEFIRQSILARSPFSVMNMGKLLNIFTKFLDIIEFILTRIVMNVNNMGSTLCVVDTLKYIKEFTLIKTLPLLRMWKDFQLNMKFVLTF